MFDFTWWIDEMQNWWDTQKQSKWYKNNQATPETFMLSLVDIQVSLSRHLHSPPEDLTLVEGGTHNVFTTYLYYHCL